MKKKTLTTAVLCGLTTTFGTQISIADGRIEEVIVTATKRAPSKIELIL